ncbi:hypothetical protein CDD81_3764 [Ophiocordyceps australis]|uniref:Coenzyme Q-binding protein COQ10 START domain-containing protein n=1 Tax=Ophiocordyceps australis TaxID=1399860 RepID=A0A2C5Y871_9HYPO|nr:hypothetical protein CDD81_3764 [Ophiocordyceps australis]
MALISTRFILPRCGYHARVSHHAPVSLATTSIAASRRTLFQWPGFNRREPSDLQRITVTRTLPYTPHALFNMIADIESYRGFVPYCLDSRVTAWSEPEASGQRLPTRAELTVGFAGLKEKFTSELVCEPGVSVRAFSGPGDLAGWQANSEILSGAIEKLAASWTLHPIENSPESPDPTTKVQLVVDFQFTTPIYDIMGRTFTRVTAEAMIEAFESRAKEKLS